MVALTETWLTPSTYSSELFGNQYHVHRKDRGSRGGGTLLALRTDNSSHAERLDFLETDGEDLWVRVTHKSLILYACVVYFPPNTTSEKYQVFYEKILSECAILQSKNVIIFGDFNFPSGKNPTSIYDYFCSFYNLTQQNTVYNSNSHMLDIILSNVKSTDVIISRHDFPLVCEDKHHPTLSFSFTYNVQSYKSPDALPSDTNLGWIFSENDDQPLRNVLEHHDWNLYDCPDVNSATESFYEELYDIFNQTLKKRSPNPHNNDQVYPKWFTGEIIHHIHQKHKFHRLWKLKKSNHAYTKFKTFRKESKQLISRAYETYTRKAENSIADDPKQFWSYVNDKRRGCDRLNHMTLNDLEYNGYSEIAEGFATFFQTVFSKNAPKLDISSITSCSRHTLTTKLTGVSTQDITNAFQKLKPKHSMGPDLIPPFLLKKIAMYITEPLKHIFNLSIHSNTFPEIWKLTKVTPIYKKGKKSAIDNYRPIAVLSAPAKLLESIVYSQIYHQIKHALNENQHGFRPTLSPSTNLMNLTNYINKSFEKLVHVDVIYTDFEKAFDKVDHDILLKKLNNMGFSQDLLTYMASYLSNRRQYVSYGHHLSLNFKTNSGIPQGSNLGPLLFLLFINDIGQTIEYSKYLLFADDIKLFRAIDSLIDSILLQNDIDSLVKWSDVNKLPFSVQKCSVVTFTRSKDTLLFPYHMKNINLIRKNEVRDLGVIFEANLSFKTHICEIVSRANKMLGFVLRNARSFTNGIAIRRTYEALVRSILEYSSIIWAPSERNHILEIERVQKRFMRYLYMREYTYYPFLFPSLFLSGMLEFHTLQARRKMFLGKHFYKLLTGGIHNPCILKEINFFVPNNYNRARHHVMFYTSKSRTSSNQNTPINKAMQLLNEAASTLDIFRCTYTQFSEYLLTCIQE